MSHAANIPIRDSIVTRMLVVTLGLYLLITVGVTLSHVWIEYQYQKANIVQDLEDLESAFKDGLAVSLWGLDQKALKASVKGMLRIPTLVGVRIITAEDATVAIGGIVTEHGETGNVGLHVNLSGLSDIKTTFHSDEAYTFEMFEHQFPITHVLDGESISLGRAAIYSNSSVIYRSMKLHIAMLMVTVILTLVTFSMVLLWAVNRYVRRPLGILTSATAGISLDSLGSFSIDTKTSRRNEIKLLEETMVSMVSKLHDAISMREKSEASLHKSEVQLRAILDNTEAVIYLKDIQGRYITINRRFEELYGVDRGTIGGQTDADIFPAEVVAAYYENDQQVIAAGVAMQFDEIAPGDDGLHSYLSVKFPLTDADGKIYAICGISTDITERKRSEEEIHQLRNYLSNIFDSMPSILIGVDLDGNITQWNLAAQTMTGVSHHEVLGQPLEQAFPRLSGDIGKVHLAIKMRREESIVKRAYQQNGETCFEDVTIYPLIANGVEGAVIRIDDVTEQVRIEEMMIQSEKMLSVGGLAAGMAHEINNPLGGIIQTAAVMSDRLTGELPANYRAAEESGTSMEAIRKFMEARGISRMLHTIIDSGQRAARIVDNMLSFARKDNSSVSSFDINYLLEQTILLAETDYNLKKQYDFRQIKIIREYEDELPVVPCESQKMQQVLLNLFKNAAQAMQEAETENPCVTLRTYYDSTRAQVCIEVSDNGPGIDEKIRKRIFEPFFTTKPVGIGTGLGLSVSYFIVTETHGGDINVQSRLGEGSTFSIYLPVEGTNNA